MIDTVKLAIVYPKRPTWLNAIKMKSGLDPSKGTFTTKIYPSKSYKQTEIYVPTLQFVDSPSYEKDMGRVFTLYIEASLPKLFFGNNFDELTDELFNAVVNKLSTLLWTIYDIKIAPTDISQAPVAKIDYSKNIVFTDRTPVSSIIEVVAAGDISKTYDVQKTNFRNGGMIYHIHANIIDIVFYDKIADLAKAKTSEKRSVEKQNYTQLKLVKEFKNHPNLSVFRYEIRLNTMAKIRKELRAIGADDDLQFIKLFRSDISQRILSSHWEKITSWIPKDETLASTPSQILIAYVNANSGTKFAEASAHTLMQLIRKEVQDERGVRNIIECLFSKNQYRNLKKIGLNQPINPQITGLAHITKSIQEMKPISIAESIQDV